MLNAIPLLGVKSRIRTSSTSDQVPAGELHVELHFNLCTPMPINHINHINHKIMS